MSSLSSPQKRTEAVLHDTVRITLQGDAKAVAKAIQQLHISGFVEVGLWCQPQLI